MKIIIAGGSGFLGNALEKFFTEKQNEVIVLTRNPQKSNDVFWDASTIGDWTKELNNADVLINMTGKSVDCRYNKKNKEEILSSRIKSTQILQKALEICQNPPKTWLNASSATIYIHAETQLNDEENGIIGDDFSMNICKAWEATFFEKELPNTRKVALRTSIVLGRNGGAFPKIKTITKLGLGGNQGKGEQMMSWIHEKDFCRAIEHIMKHEELSGKINVTAPKPVKNSDFMSKLRKTMKMPFGIGSPVFLLEFVAIFIKTETELLLKSRNVYPKTLLSSGFNFDFPIIEGTFEDLLC